MKDFGSVGHVPVTLVIPVSLMSWTVGESVKIS